MYFINNDSIISYINQKVSQKGLNDMKETKEVLHVICVLCQTIEKFKKLEKFSVKDIKEIIPLIEAISNASENFSEIKNVEHIFINGNSKGKKIRRTSVASLRPLSYFEFTLKNEKKKRICITYFSLKQRRKMIKIIREQANIDIDYNKMEQKDLSIYKRKNKRSEPYAYSSRNGWPRSRP